ncbi:MAG TPA: methionyl-tRNA formyltransferase [Bacteroidales bacterium]|nr:methionyl-tRNA formyltransferase [Bacteroidales bacterium]HSA44059.1 methionyl-tRNA formyltransferase [Bacteroidales bacterium]
MEHRLSIIFFGTPVFAVPSLDAIVKKGYLVKAVVTVPDKPAGRGYALRASAVKEYALRHKLTLLQPEKLDDEAFIRQLTSLNPDIQVVVAFKKLPELVWRIPPLGTVNLHASLLPDYRGAAPINRVLMNGETMSGLTTFFINETIDTGHILLQTRLALDETMTAGALHDLMMPPGAALLIKSLEGLRLGTLAPRPQETADTGRPLRLAPKISKAECRINWALPSDTVYNMIRGLSPSPAAYSVLHREGDPPAKVKLLRVKKEISGRDSVPGIVCSDGRTSLKIACIDGWIVVEELQMEGHRSLLISDFLNGVRVLSSCFFE